MPVQPKNSPWVWSICSFLIALFILLQSFSLAIKNGMHTYVLEELFEFYARSISIAVSNLEYHLKGYVGYEKVYETLRNDGFTESNNNNSTALDLAIQKAATLRNPQSAIFTLTYNDPGYINYVRLSFLLFGYKISSVLFLYFAFLLIQIIFYFIEFRKNSLATAALVLFLLSHYAIIAVLAYVPGVVTPHNIRFLPVLSILPIMHVSTLVLFPKSIKLGTSLRVCVQSLMFLFVLQCRSSAIWFVFFLFFVLLIGIFYRRKKSSKGSEIATPNRLWKGKEILTRVKVLWPVFLLLIGVFFSPLKPHNLHPLYSERDKVVLGHHPFWLPLYLGLAINPDIKAEFSAHPMKFSKADGMMERYQPNDQDGTDAAFQWLKDHGRSEQDLFSFSPGERVDYRSAFRWFKEHPAPAGELGRAGGEGRKFDDTKDFKWGEYEHILEGILKEVIVRRPLQVLKTVLIIKPVLFFVYYKEYFMRINLQFPLFFVGGILAYLLSLTWGSDTAHISKFLGLSGGMFAFSMIVPLAVYPMPQAMCEQSLLLIMFFYWVVFWGTARFVASFLGLLGIR